MLQHGGAYMLGNMETDRYGPMNMASALLSWMSMKQYAQLGVSCPASSPWVFDEILTSVYYIIHRGPQVLAFSFCHRFLVCVILLFFFCRFVPLLCCIAGRWFLLAFTCSNGRGLNCFIFRQRACSANRFLNPLAIRHEHYKIR